MPLIWQFSPVCNGTVDLEILQDVDMDGKENDASAINANESVSFCQNKIIYYLFMLIY